MITKITVNQNQIQIQKTIEITNDKNDIITV